MSDHEERKEKREEEREERKEERAAKHSHHIPLIGKIEDFDTKRAHEEIAKIKEEIQDIQKAKDIHVHKTHDWLYRLHHAAFKILRTNEDDLDQAKPEATWIPDTLDVIFNADKDCVALGKAINAAGSHTAKDADFDKPDVQKALKALEEDIDRVIQLIPNS